MAEQATLSAATRNPEATMEIDPTTHDRSMYRTLSSTVVPRPIGWVSTTGTDGVDNLAPYSFFNVVSISPPVLMFAPGVRPHGLTDTARNVQETEEFVVNVVTHPFAEAMNATSASLGSDESEFDHADVERAPSRKVRPPRVAGIEVAYECELYDMQEVGSHHIVMGEVVYAHVDDALLDGEGKVDVGKLDVVGRLAGSFYDSVENRFRMERPD